MNKNQFFSLSVSALLALPLTAQTFDPKISEVWDPIPKVITPGGQGKAPSDAIVLLDGTSTKEWVKVEKNEPITWKSEDGGITVVKGAGAIRTVKEFGDFQLHIEFRTPAVVEGTSQGRGNSGIFMQSRYELQVLDNYNNRTYSNGQAGSIYKQTMPLVNACKGPGEWQMYDVIYNAPRFNADGIKTSPAYITVIQNGILVQNHTEIFGTTEYDTLPKNVAHGKAPFMLQDHGNPVSYRNIWVREL
jgi:hypothetical protein